MSAPQSPILSPSTSCIERIGFVKGGVEAKIGEDFDNPASYVKGMLYIFEKPYGIFIEWKPDEPSEEGSPSESWVVTPPTGVISFNNETDALDVATKSLTELEAKAEQLKRLKFSVDIKDLRSFFCVENRKNKSTKRGPWIRLISNDGTNFVPLHFRAGGLNEFVEALQKYATLKRSAKDNTLVLFVDEKSEALQQSVSMLFTNQGQSDFISKLISNPYSTALTGLSKVTNFLQDQVLPAILDPDVHLDTEEQRQCLESLMQEPAKQEENTVQAYIRHHEGDLGFDVVTKLDLPERPKVARDSSVDFELWNSFKKPDGSFSNPRELKLQIFRGGLIPKLRREGWKHLLGWYPWKSTEEARTELRKKSVDDYFRMKLQWKSINEDQELRFTEFRDRKALVEKDVARTDRSHRYFEGENNVNIATLFDILMTYCMYDFDLGYVQGMSDFLSPILFVMENEVDAFWSFVGLMEMMHNNFEMDQKSIRNQLMQLRDLLMVVNPKLSNYLESHQSDNMFFAFRWLLIQFKREFSFCNIQRLWEVLWTGLPCQNFHLLICVAILDDQTNTIIENKFGFTEILKHINDMSMQIALEDSLCSAEAIYHQLAAIQDKLPTHICDILGFHVSSSSSGSSSQNGSHNPSPQHQP